MNRLSSMALACVLASAFAAPEALSAEKANITLNDMPVLHQEKHHKVSCKRVFRELTESHYRQDLILDGQFYRNYFVDYLKSLDSYKIVFLQRDVDNYLKDARMLKKSVSGCELDLPYRIYNDYEKLKYEQLTTAISMLKENRVDISSDDEFQYDRSEESWPATPAERARLSGMPSKSRKKHKKKPGRKLSCLAVF